MWLGANSLGFWSLCLLVFKMVLKSSLLTCKQAYRCAAADSTLTCCQECGLSRKCSQSRWEMPCVVLNKGAILEPQPEGRDHKGTRQQVAQPVHTYATSSSTHTDRALLLEGQPQNHFQEKHSYVYFTAKSCFCAQMIIPSTAVNLWCWGTCL